VQKTADKAMQQAQWDAMPIQHPPNTSLPKTSIDRAQRVRELLDRDNVPIVFFGKVVDSSNKPISGVKIKYHIRRAGILDVVGSIQEDIFKETAISAADGIFEISGATGMTLTVEGMEKNGYDLYPNQKLAYSYSGTSLIHRPTRDKPEIFVMRSSEEQTDVKSFRRQIKLPWSGEAFHVDIDTGLPSESGILIFTPYRSAVTGRFDWNLTVELQGGGLVQAEPQTAMIAPLEGYVRTWRCGYESKDNPWRFSYDANVYYKLNGRYGRLKLQVYADAGPDNVGLYLELFYNASGGRDTEVQKRVE
jgi:hypothetical protein